MFTVYITVVNIISFLLFGLDKRRARKHLYRIPENTLFLIAFSGGTLGAWIGIYLFRHKTRRLKFTMGIPMIMLAQLFVISFFNHNF